MMSDGLATQLASAASMEAAFGLLLEYPTIGNVLAYQLVVDVYYSELLDFSEMDFVMPGPGAKDGIRKCFADLDNRIEQYDIRWMAEHQQEQFASLGLAFQALWGRPLQLIDCQNLFCELDNYARVKHPDIAGWTGAEQNKATVQTQNQLGDWC